MDFADNLIDWLIDFNFLNNKTNKQNNNMD